MCKTWSPPTSLAGAGHGAAPLKRVWRPYGWSELGYDPAIAFLGKYLSKSKNMPTQNLHTAVHSNVMRNSHKVGTTRMSTAYE